MYPFSRPQKISKPIATWENRFNAFRELINPQNPNVLSTPPTTEGIVGFIETIVPRMKSSFADATAINVRTIRHGILHVITALEFRYESNKRNKNASYSRAKRCRDGFRRS
jgi:hypothetical protein